MMENIIRELFQTWGVPDHFWHYNPTHVEPDTLNLKFIHDTNQWKYYYVEPNGVISTEMVFNNEKDAFNYFIERMKAVMASLNNS